ncbi:MAG: hypothetical protein HY925_10535, partial [Elusimicrobia bacterium]|nr:hypothetical protein [Elusimicrobiota bacterium]
MPPPTVSMRASTLPEPVSRTRAALSFSVIIPCSRPEALARCLRSLSRAQGDLEIVLALTDDACRDAAGGCAIVDARGLTPGAARNCALARASGDWLVFL